MRSHAALDAGAGEAGTSMALAQMREKIRRGVSRQPAGADLRQAREALAIATGRAQAPAFKNKANGAGLTCGSPMRERRAALMAQEIRTTRSWPGSHDRS